MDEKEILEKLFHDSIYMDGVLETIRDSSVRSYRNLYDIQRSMTGMVKYEIPLSEFELTKRLPKEKQKASYPVRYIQYLSL